MATRFNAATGTFEDDGQDEPDALEKLDVDSVAKGIADVGTGSGYTKPLQQALADAAPKPVQAPAVVPPPVVAPSAVGNSPPKPPAAPPADAPATVTRHTVLTPEGAQAIQQLDVATAEEKAAKLAEGEAAAQRKDAEAQAERDRAKLAAEHQDRVQKRLDAAQADYNARVKEYQLQYNALKGMKETDFWADKSLGYRVAAAISVALGAVSQAFGGRNVGAELIAKEIEAHGARQRATITGQRELVEKAGVGMEGAKAARDREVTLWEAAAYDRASHDIQARAAQYGGPEERAKAQAAAAALQAKAAEKKALLLKMTGDQVVTDTGRQTQEERLAAIKAKQKPKGPGGGGSNSAALQEIIDGQSPATVQAKYKLSDKTLKGLVQTASSSGANAARGGRLALAEDKAVTARVNDWAKQHELKQVEHTQHDIDAILKVLEDAPHNPHAQASAFERSVSAARGGPATLAALNLALKHMGGGIDSVEGFVKRLDSGEFGEAQVTNLKNAMRAQLASKQKEGKDLYDAFEAWRETQPAEAQRQLEGERARLFGGFSGFGGQKAPASPTAHPYVEAARAAKGRAAPAPALPPGATPATKGGRPGILLNGHFYPRL